MTDDGLPSEKLLDLYRQVQKAKTKEERRRLMTLLGEQFAAEHDDSDETATDDVHGYFEALAQAKLAYEQAALRVGRLAADCVSTFLKEREVPAAEESTTAAEHQPN